ncbi:MAG: transcription elongation factor GreA [Clostridiaceae bacterium]|nr:transcription elongation factor GreA [Clostridiaceae bacterium]
MPKEILISHERLKALQEELEILKTKTRKDVAEKIKQALSFGDLSENSEYDEAKNEQAEVENRILEIENTLKNARIIDQDDIDTTIVSIGSKVLLLDLTYNEEVTYTIVGSLEADPLNNKISNESPVGKALLGYKVNDEVTVSVPSGSELKFKILDISK